MWKRCLIYCIALCLSLTTKAQDAIPESNLYFTITPSRTHVFEQEAVLLTYTFHAYGDMGLSVGMNSKPDFDGLVSQEIRQPNNKTVYAETVNGRVQRAGVVKQCLVFPQRAGTIVVPGLTFNCEVRSVRSTSPAVTIKRRVPDVTLQVEPLPRPQPASFHGAVGQFSVQSSLSSNYISTGDIVSRVIAVSGKGNLRLITPPQLRFPNDLESFDVTFNDQVRVAADGMSGTMTFQYPFMPKRVGRFTLPADTLCYFDPSAREYRFLPLPSVTIDVAQGERSQEEIEAETALRNSDIRPDQPQSSVRISLSAQLWVCIATLLLLIVGFFIADRYFTLRHRKQVKQQGVEGAQQRALKRLKTCEQHIAQGDNSSAYALLEETLLSYAAEHLSQQNLSSRELVAQALLEIGCSEVVVNKWLALLADVDKNRFAPTTAQDDTAQQLIASAREIILTLF